MTSNSVAQILFYCVMLTGLSFPIGRAISVLINGELVGALKPLHRIEEFLLTLCGANRKNEMTWVQYAKALTVFSIVGVVSLYGIERIQDVLPLNPLTLSAIPPDLAFNTAMSFITNTNWQAYGGESTMSFFTQMFGLTVHNFVSAACGIAVLFALCRGFVRERTTTIGNFWVDLIRATTFVLLPLSLILALILISQGVVQTFTGSAKVHLMEPFTSTSGKIEEQDIALGPVASQVAIKQLGTNGGGFYNVNSAHPFENPTPLSNFLEVLSILLLPAALCHTFGAIVKDARQGWALYAVMMSIFLLFLIPCVILEQGGTRSIRALGVNDLATSTQAGGNLEGKEVRFGVANSALWAIATTAASNGSVNSMHDSFTPLGGMFPLILIQLGEVIFGGVGSGLYGMIVFALVTVFISGLMVGRTPEYLGKKIEVFEMKMCSLIILLPCVLTLLGTAAVVLVASGKASISNPGAHGFTQILYAYSSMGNNNGSAFAGLSANIPLHNLLGGAIMWISRFWLAIPILALAGSLAQKTRVPNGAGTLPTHSIFFIALLIGVVLLVGVLNFFPALALGPIAEHLIAH